MKLRKLVALLSLLSAFSSCYYQPFIKYRLNKEGFKKFSKREKLAGDNSNPHRNYVLHKYDWDLEVFPNKKRIKGNVKIFFSPTIDQDTFLFDLQKKMKIHSFYSSNSSAKIKRKGDLLYLIFDDDVPAYTRTILSIQYEGKPANVTGEGPIVWKKDSMSRPWISSTTEGIGPHFMMPCSALLGKEPDTTLISITAPSDLVAAANGQFVTTSINEEKGTKTSQFQVSNPINIYNISFNLGHFVKLVKPYTDIEGKTHDIECLVLDYNKEVADTFYNQVPKIMQILEESFGLFPWWNDGCRLIESNFSAMEHQSGIAMGDDYTYDWKGQWNLTLVHELAHEWWGNKITGKDYCDVWIHEGMTTYAEALFLEKYYGEEEYNKRMRDMVFSTYNKIPIHKVCGVLYNSWTNDQDQDIYDKGALMIHSLRKVVNDDLLFLGTLKQLQEESGPRNISSEEMVERLSTLLGKDYSPLLNWYLEEQAPPTLEIKIDRKERVFYYRWNREVPFFEEGKIFIKTDDENETIIELNPSLEFQSTSTKEYKKLQFQIEKSIYYRVKNISTKRK